MFSERIIWFNEQRQMVFRDIVLVQSTKRGADHCLQVNVFLRITGKRPDGYHNLASLFHVRTL